MLVDGYTIAMELNAGRWKAFRDGQSIKADDLKIGPNSIDVTLGDRLLVRQPHTFIDPYKPETAQYDEMMPISDEGSDPYFMLMPNTLYLGFVRERFEARTPIGVPVIGASFDAVAAITTGVQCPCAIVYAVPMVDGRSTLGRLGVTVHETAGFGDFGFEGCFTLEIAAREMTKLYVGMRIAQVSFQTTTPNVVKKVYTGAYSGADHVGRPVAPRLGRDRF